MRAHHLPLCRLERRPRSRPRTLPQGRQHGAVGLMFAFMILMLFGFMGMALDLAHAYNRRTELQTIVDAAALAGAKALDGTAAGVTAAATAAATRAASLTVNYHKAVTFNNAALGFSSQPDTAAASWKSLAQASAAPAGLTFLRVDAAALTAADGTSYGKIDTIFMRLLSPSLSDMTTSAWAVAGHVATPGIVLLYQ
jgi:uncharacterized membrane protein